MEGKRLSEAELREFFLEQYEDNPGDRTVCSYIIEFEKYDQYQRKDICHARAFPCSDKRAMYGKAIAIHSSIWRSTNATKPYIEWIFDPLRSPWRKVLKDVRLYRNDAGHIIGFSLFDMDAPYRTIMNLLFASRFHSEKRDKLAIWFKSLALGLDEAAAFALAHGLIDAGKERYYYNRYNDSHVAIYPVDYTRNGVGVSALFATCVRRLREGDPNDTSPAYWKGRKMMADVNAIWFDWDRPPKCNLFNITPANVRPTYNGRFVRCFNKMQHDIGIDLAPPSKETVTINLKTLVERQQDWTT